LRNVAVPVGLEKKGKAYASRERANRPVVASSTDWKRRSRKEKGNVQSKSVLRAKR